MKLLVMLIVCAVFEGLNCETQKWQSKSYGKVISIGKWRGNPEYEQGVLKIAIKRTHTPKTTVVVDLNTQKQRDAWKVGYIQSKTEARIYEELGPCGHLPNFFGFDYNERDVYIFMEYVDGYQMYEYFKSLRQLMIENNSIDAAISHFDQPGVFFFIKQLVYIGERFAKHYLNYDDIKPENIMLDVNGDFDYYRLLDIGASTAFVREGVHRDRGAPRIARGTRPYIPHHNYEYNQTSRRTYLGALCLIMYEFVYFQDILPLDRYTSDQQQINIKRYALKLMKERMVPSIQAMVEYIDNLAFEEEPDYLMIRSMLGEAHFEVQYYEAHGNQIK